MRAALAILAALFACLLACLAAVVPARAGGTVEIGCMFPMTGRGALYGHDSVAAIEMAAGEVNAGGGAAGRRLSVHFADSQSKPAFAVSIARRFIDAQQLALTGALQHPPRGNAERGPPAAGSSRCRAW
jgi:branched-chain amino acid transport system substrate-binding protein